VGRSQDPVSADSAYAMERARFRVALESESRASKPLRWRGACPVVRHRTRPSWCSSMSPASSPAWRSCSSYSRASSPPVSGIGPFTAVPSPLLRGGSRDRRSAAMLPPPLVRDSATGIREQLRYTLGCRGTLSQRRRCESEWSPAGR